MAGVGAVLEDVGVVVMGVGVVVVLVDVVVVVMGVGAVESNVVSTSWQRASQDCDSGSIR